MDIEQSWGRVWVQRQPIDWSRIEPSNTLNSKRHTEDKLGEEGVIDHVQLRVSTLLMSDVLVAKSSWSVWTSGNYKDQALKLKSYPIPQTRCFFAWGNYYNNDIIDYPKDSLTYAQLIRIIKVGLYELVPEHMANYYQWNWQCLYRYVHVQSTPHLLDPSIPLTHAGKLLPPALFGKQLWPTLFTGLQPTSRKC